MSQDAPVVVRWGREIETVTDLGFPCRVYRERPHSVAELLLDARRWHAREFVVQGSRRLTFAEFEATVARTANWMESLGVGAGDRVFLLGFNHIEWLSCFWAAQCLGACTVLGNAWWSEAELANALELVQPALLVTERNDTGASCPVVSFEASSSIGPAPTLRLMSEAEDDVAIIMFSSGTTGDARAVQMTHRGIVANIHNLLALTGRLPDQLPPERPGTVSLLASPLFHLAGVQIQINTLTSGGRLVLPRGRFDAREVLELIEREKVRVWGGIPAMVARVLGHPDLDQFDVSSVSSVPMGGAAISPELREQVKATFPGTRRRVGSLYGHTEAGGVLAAGSGEELDGRPGCVGRPLPVVEVRVACPDEEGIGEILARTPTVTAGYLGESRPLHDKDGWIRSGDLGRLDEEGYLYLLGRSKDIVIRGGENIACSHVESCLLTHPEVLEVAVLGLAHHELGEELAACVAVSTIDRVEPAELEAYARARLARFEVPTRWWLRTEPLPMTPSGKILKRELEQNWPANAN